MAFRLIPKEERFFDDFSALAEQIQRGAALLNSMLAPDRPIWDKADEIKEVEHKCDFITHEIIQRLNRTFVTPLDREDIHALAGHLDEVVDLIDGCARRVSIFHIKETKQHGVILSEVLVRATRSIEETVKNMKDPKAVTAANRQLKVLEEEGDAIYHEAVEKLFSTTTDAIEVMKWKELYDKLEDAIDQCEDVGNTLQSIALKNG